MTQNIAPSNQIWMRNWLADFLTNVQLQKLTNEFSNKRLISMKHVSINIINSVTGENRTTRWPFSGWLIFSAYPYIFSLNKIYLNKNTWKFVKWSNVKKINVLPILWLRQSSGFNEFCQENRYKISSYCLLQYTFHQSFSCV